MARGLTLFTSLSNSLRKGLGRGAGLSPGGGLSGSDGSTGSGGAVAQSFGALTRAGAGGIAAPSGASAISGGTATGYSLSGGYVVPTSDGSATSGTMTFTGSTEEWTISVVANGWSVKNSTELETAAEHASLAYGDEILLRTGSYTGKTIKRTVALVGTFTAPTDIDEFKGPDLDTANYVKIKAHTGASPLLEWLEFDGATRPEGGFRVTGLNFERTAVTDVAGIDATAMVYFAGSIGNCAVDNNTLTSTETLAEGTDQQRYNGIYFSPGTYTGIKIMDNDMQYCWMGIVCGAAELIDNDVIGNNVEYAWNDCYKFWGVQNQRVNWNHLHNKWDVHESYGGHGDFVQWSLTNYMNNIVGVDLIGNRIARGNGRGPTYIDGQGLFMDDLNQGTASALTNTIQGLRVWGNTILCTLVRGISMSGTEDADIRCNTVMRDLEKNDSNTSIILTPSDTSSGSGGTIAFNVTKAVQNTLPGAFEMGNVLVDQTQLAYDAAFVDPESDSLVTDVGAQYAILAGSAADLQTPKAGASPYFDYENRTFTTLPEAVDTTAPELTSPAAVETSATTADGTVDTDEDNGDLYFVASTSSTPASKAQVKAGQDHTGSAAADSGSQAVTATGTQNVTFSGLTPATTYYPQYMQEDDAGNQSDVVVGSAFTTEATINHQYLTTKYDGTNKVASGTWTFNFASFGPEHANRKIVLFSYGAAEHTLTINGQAVTQTDTTLPGLKWHEISLPTDATGDGSMNVVVTNTSGGVGSFVMLHAWAIYPASGTAVDHVVGGSGATSFSLSDAEIVNGGIALIGGYTSSGVDPTLTWNGVDSVTKNYAADAGDTDFAVAATILCTESNTTRDLTINDGVAASKHFRIRTYGAM